jgi:hypothetical protein
MFSDARARIGSGGGIERIDRHREGGAIFVARDVDDVGDDRRGRRPRARARAFEKQAADEIALGDDGVERAGDIGQRMVGGDEARLDMLIETAFVAFGHADQADAVAERGGLANVGGDQAADTLRGHRVEIEPGAETERGEDRQFVRGVDPVDVEGRIGLGIAFGLCRGERIGEARALALHQRQDIIAGAVEDAVDARDLVRRGAFADRLDDRDAACDGGFIFQRRVLRLGDPRQIEPVMRDHRLVRGDERLAGAQRLTRERQRRAVGAADHFDHHIDILSLDQRRHIVFPAIGRQIDAAILLAIARGDGDDLDRAAGAAGDQVAIGLEQPDDAAADDADTGERDTQRRARGGGGGLRRHAGTPWQGGPEPAVACAPIGFSPGNKAPRCRRPGNSAGSEARRRRAGTRALAERAEDDGIVGGRLLAVFGGGAAELAERQVARQAAREAIPAQRVLARNRGAFVDDLAKGGRPASRSVGDGQDGDRHRLAGLGVEEQLRLALAGQRAGDVETVGDSGNRGRGAGLDQLDAAGAAAPRRRARDRAGEKQHGLLLFELRRLALCVERKVDEIADPRRQRARSANQADHISLDIESREARREPRCAFGFQQRRAVNARLDHHRGNCRQIGEIGIAPGAFGDRGGGWRLGVSI